jgi:hypothetical protein
MRFAWRKLILAHKESGLKVIALNLCGPIIGQLISEVSNWDRFSRVGHGHFAIWTEIYTTHDMSRFFRSVYSATKNWQNLEMVADYLISTAVLSFRIVTRSPSGIGLYIYMEA